MTASMPESDNLGAADRRAAAKGWCPTAYRPMPSGDGLLLRVRPRLARLTQAQALGLCETAGRFGSGIIELTHRANLQLRGLHESQYPQALAELTALGLVDADPAREERRNIVVAPLWRAGDDTEVLATELAARLHEFPALPPKFGFAVDAGPAPVLGDVSADIRIERGRSGRLIVRADGAGEGVAVAPLAAVDAALALASWFAASASTTRMKSHLATHALPAALAPDEAPAPPAALPLPGASAHGPVVGAAFGQVQSAALARLLRDSGASALRVVPNRTLLLEDAGWLPQALAADRAGGNADANLALDGNTRAARIDGATVHATADFLTAGDDPLLRVDACPGAPACAAATVETRRLARSLAPLLASADATGSPRSLHVSGCAKGCARTRPADLTLTGRAGRFDLVRGGRAWDAPCSTGLPPEAVPALIGAP